MHSVSNARYSIVLFAELRAMMAIVKVSNKSY